MKTSLLKSLWLIIMLSPLVLSAQTPSLPASLSERISKVENGLTGMVVIEGDKPFSIKERMELYGVPAVTIAVVKDYKIDWAKAYGYADVAEKRQADVSTRFQAASLSKSLNAVGLLRLAQEKKIDLYADINNYLTSWKFPYDSVSKNKKISVANLLSHTAGLTVHGFPGYKPGDEMPTLVNILNGQKPANTAAVRSNAEPGIKSVYSGGGTTITQMIVMDVTKAAYADYELGKVLKPLGMSNSFYGSNASLGGPNVLATAYLGSGAAVPGKYHIYPEQAAAALWTTPTDMAKFMIETQLSLQGKSNKVLSQEMTRLMVTPYLDSNAGLGVFVYKRGDGSWFEHGGANEGFRCQYYGSLDGGNGVIIMINSENGAIMQEIVHSVADAYEWKGFYNPILKKLFPVSEEVAQSYVGKYQIAPQFILSISRENGQMKAQATGQGSVEIFPETENKYFVKVAPIGIEFVKDANGKVEKAIVHQNGQQLSAARLP